MQRDKTTSDAGDLKRARRTHPSSDEWMEWLYEELPRERHAALEAHLASCVQCESQVRTWKGTMENLDGWNVAASGDSKSAHAWWTKGSKWAAAAVLVVAGFVAGRANSTPSPAQLSAAVR